VVFGWMVEFTNSNEEGGGEGGEVQTK